MLCHKIVYLRREKEDDEVLNGLLAVVIIC